MSKKRYILLEVQDHRADELLSVLTRRDYIKHINFDSIDQRRQFKDCPICKEELEKEWKITVTEKMLESCLVILNGLKISKTMVVYNYSLIEEVRPIDYERAVLIQSKTLYAARLLGIIGHYIDGTQDTFFITDKGLKFLSDKEPLSPSDLVVVKNQIMRAEGTLSISDVKHKDSLKFNSLVKTLEDTIDNLPNEVIEFARSGQTSLL